MTSLHILAVAAGLLIGVAFTLSPLMVWALVAAALLARFAGRGLPDADRTSLTTWRCLRRASGDDRRARRAGAVQHGPASARSSRDLEAVLGRALRMRDIYRRRRLKFDYVVAFDDTARSYLSVLT
jgi:hypothetical protein